MAEYPFATLTLQGLELPRLVSEDGSPYDRGGPSLGSSSHTLGIALKVIITVLLSVAFIVASFYVALFFRKWKQKRGGRRNKHSKCGMKIEIKEILFRQIWNCCPTNVLVCADPQAAASE